jgi:hypothetical protein
MRDVEINGNKYRLEYGINAISALQDSTNMTIDEIFKKLADMANGKFDFRLIRSIFWAGLLTTNHLTTIEEAGDILDTAQKGALMGIINQTIAEFGDSFMQKIEIPIDSKKKSAEKNTQ